MSVNWRKLGNAASAFHVATGELLTVPSSQDPARERPGRGRHYCCFAPPVRVGLLWSPSRHRARDKAGESLWPPPEDPSCPSL